MQKNGKSLVDVDYVEIKEKKKEKVEVFSTESRKVQFFLLVNRKKSEKEKGSNFTGLKNRFDDGKLGPELAVIFL